MLPLLLIVAAPLADPTPITTVPAITLPTEIHARPGRICTIAADTTGKAVRWVLAADDADLVPVPTDGKSALFCSPKPGRYVLFAWTATGDVPSEAARCVVIVGEPPTPAPTDPLTTELRALYTTDATPEKSAHLAQLAAVYREAVRYAENADVRTVGELATRIRTAASSLVPAQSLTGIRKRIAEEITRQLPDDGDRPLDAATRKLAATLFTRIATSLEVGP